MASRGILPPNIENEGRGFGGIFRIRNIVETCILITVIFLFQKIFLFAIPQLIRYAIVFFIGTPITLLSLVGIGDLSLSEWYADRKSFRKSQAIYPFKIPTKKTEEKKGIFSRKRKEKSSEH